MVYLIGIWVVLCIIVGVFGRNRKLGFLGFFLLSLLFSPVFVFLGLLLTIPKTSKYA